MYNQWQTWFAWYPVDVEGKKVWLKTVERMLEIDLMHSSASCAEIDLQLQ